MNRLPAVRKIGVQTRSITGTVPDGNRYESSLEGLAVFCVVQHGILRMGQKRMGIYISPASAFRNPSDSGVLFLGTPQDTRP